MKIFGYEINKSVKEKKEVRSIYDSYSIGGVNYSTYGSFVSSKALTLSAVYRAVNLISDAISSLQMKIYTIDKDGYKKEDNNDPLYHILGYEPNFKLSRFDFFKMIITSILLQGNAYIRVFRNPDFSVKYLDLIDSGRVGIEEDIRGFIKYTIQGVNGKVDSADIIHIRNYPVLNNLKGISTITYAANSLDISYNSETHASEFFKGDASAAALLTSEASITPKQEAELRTKFANTQNGIVFLGNSINTNFHSLGISPRDSQLLETRAFNIIDIARFFNVNPILLFDNTKATYSNIENAQLDFLNTTLLPIIEKLENEFVRKLILPSQRNSKEIRFDLSNLLRADSNSRATYFKSLFEMGVISANQISKELNLPKIEGEGGDKHFISTNLQQSDNLVVNQDNSLDNKLKNN